MDTVWKACYVCKGTRTVLEWGRTERTCGYCNGSGKILVYVGHEQEQRAWPFDDNGLLDAVSRKAQP